MEPTETPNPPPRTPSFTESAALILFGRLMSFVISTALPLVLVRRLDPAAFGLYKQVFLVVNTALNVIPLGFGMNIYYFLSRERTRTGSVICNTVATLFMAGLLALITLCFWPQLLRQVSQEPQIVRFAPLIGIIIVMWIVGSLFELIPIANQEMKLAMVVSIASQIVRTLLFLLAAAFFGTIMSLIWAGIIYGLLLTSALLYYLSLRFPAFWREFDWDLLKRQFSYAVPLGLMGLVWYFQSDLHNYFVSNQFSAAEFAIYSIGCFQLPLVQLLMEAVNSVLISQIAKLQELGDTDEIIALSIRAMRKLAAALFPAYGFLMVTGHEFIAFLFTQRYAASWPIFIINLTIIPISIFTFDPVMRAYAEHRYLFFQEKIVMFLLLLATLWWATPRLGMQGAIGSVVFVMVVDKVILTFFYARILHFGRRHVPLLADTVKLGVSAAGAAAVAAGIRLVLTGSAPGTSARPVIVLLVCGVSYVMAYAVLVKLFNIVAPEEMALLQRAARGPFGVIQRQLRRS